MHSCIYEGTVTHRRREPVNHQFQYRLFMVYLDLDEMPSLVGRRSLISDSRHATRSFLRSDHLFGRSQTLADEVRDMIHQRTGHTSRGPIRLLTQLRSFGYYMSPLNLFYAFDESDRHVETIVAEVNNTPWGERHCYVLGDGNREGEGEELRFSHNKEFHVSPFMGMDLRYHWSLSKPGSGLRLHLANSRDSKPLFDAGVTLERRELNRQQLRRMTVRYPLMTAQITAGIYYQALNLWWKQCPVYSHPKTLTNSPSPARKLPSLPETSTTAVR